MLRIPATCNRLSSLNIFEDNNYQSDAGITSNKIITIADLINDITSNHSLNIVENDLNNILTTTVPGTSHQQSQQSNLQVHQPNQLPNSQQYGGASNVDFEFVEETSNQTKKFKITLKYLSVTGNTFETSQKRSKTFYS